MKAILLSVRPEWVAKILNKEKTIEIRKKFPKDYVGLVYIYCTKPKDDGLLRLCGKHSYYTKGKVVARFWCDNVEDTFFQKEESFNNEIEKTLQNSCLTYDELWNYAENKIFYKINISKLEVFNEPRELSEFRSCHANKIKYVEKEVRKQTFITFKLQNRNHALTKAPHNYYYIEELEDEIR